VRVIRYDESISKWHDIPTKRVLEDVNGHHYTAVIPRFSLFAIVGGPEMPEPTFSVSAFEVSSNSVSRGDEVTATYRVTNITDEESVYAANLWINGTIEESRAVTIDGNDSEDVEFVVTAAELGDMVLRADRYSATVTVAAEPTPTATPARPTSTPTRIAPTATRTPVATATTAPAPRVATPTPAITPTRTAAPTATPSGSIPAAPGPSTEATATPQPSGPAIETPEEGGGFPWLIVLLLLVVLGGAGAGGYYMYWRRQQEF
jgi:hypothetical protein